MASQYDSIKTPKELLDLVAMHGLSTKIEDICRAQDIFGRASIDDLISLANDNGRVDQNGNPDPNGSCSNGRRGTQQCFYQVLYHIWNWEDATRFYNQYTNPEMRRLRAIADNAAETQRHLEREKHMREDAEESFDRLVARNDKVEAELAAAQQEILQLKAKLYDTIFG